jgi:hypothetical protein
LKSVRRDTFSIVGDFLGCQIAPLHEAPGLLHHLRLPLHWRSQALAVLPGFRQTRPGAFDDQIPLKLGDGAQHVEKQPAVRRRRIGVAVGGSKVNAPGSELGDKLGKVLHAAADAIELPAREGIALLAGRQRFGEDRAIAATAAGLLGEDVLALDAKAFGRLDLQTWVLITGAW